MMGLKLIHISKRGNWWSNPLDITLVVLTINCLCKTFPDFAIKVLCFLTTINLTFKFQLMVHEKLSWRNCECPVDLWQPGQIVLKKFHPSKIPEGIYQVPEYLLALTGFFSQLSFPPPECDQGWPTHGIPLRRRKGRIVSFLQAELCSQFNFNIIYNIITWLRGFLARNCSGCPWRRDV